MYPENSVVSALLAMGDHISQEKAKLASRKNSLPGGTVTYSETPPVHSEVEVAGNSANETERVVLEQVEHLTQSVAENVINDVGNNSPLDYGDSDGDDHDFNGTLEDANNLLYGDLPEHTEESEEMDASEPAGTAAIPQGSSIIFYGDPNYIDTEVTVLGLPPVLQAVPSLGVTPNNETFSQNPADSSQNTSN
jgi:hypothetical protein